MLFISAQMVSPYSSTETTTAWKNSHFILSERSDFSIINNFPIEVHTSIWTLTKCMEKKARWELHENATYYFQQTLEAALHKTVTLQPLSSNLTNYLYKTIKKC